MIRKVIEINEERCCGCGACASACHEGAIGMVNGKAKLLREDYCDGLGNCLPVCPVNAISFIEREAADPVPSAMAKIPQWPIQMRLTASVSPRFYNADLLIAADCTAFTYPSFRNEFIAGRCVLIGCPKLDDTDYSRILTDIFRKNTIRRITVARMTVPCCKGLERAVMTALQNCGKGIPCRVVIFATDGSGYEEREI